MPKIRAVFALLSLSLATLIIAPGCTSSATSASTGEYIDDSVVTTKVKTAYLNDKGTPGGAISVETYKGTVNLSGFVDTAEQKAKAESLAAKVEGVKSVSNNIVVKTSKGTAGAFIDDSVITTKVKSALVKTDGTPSAAISVETFRGEVLLSGFVDTAAEKSKAQEVAEKIEGVKAVTNGVVVK